MSFTPKFVDLVRNSTTVQGTGAVVLGAAPAGFTGFAEACSAGDQFYYCIQGTDKPAEREVGKGTLLADGSIGREALGGAALTKFSVGAKTISLVAAAEWYGRVEAVASQPASSSVDAVASRTALAAIAAPNDGEMRYLGEGQRKGWFRFASGDQTVRVAADPQQGMTVARAIDPSGASGAWLRQCDGGVWPEWFGAARDDVSDDGPALAAALAWLASTSGLPASSWYRGSPRLRLNAGNYFLGQTTLDLAHTLVIEGEGTGLDGAATTRLRWSAGTTGIRVQRYNTSAASTVDPGTHSAGDGATLRGLFLEGAWDLAAGEAEAHGIHLRARATIEDVYVYKFQGDGVHIGASSPNGNANNFQLNRVTCTGNRDGFAVGTSGSADVNAGLGLGVNAMGNRRWGIYDNSFLGNSWIGCHTADNGLVAGTPASVVSDGTYRYCVRRGQAAAAATTAPTSGTDNAAWICMGEGGVSSGNNILQWTSGMATREGGSYAACDANNRCVFVGCYAEGGQGFGQIGGQAIALGGLGNFVGVWAKAENGVMKSDADFTCARALTVAGTSRLGDKLTLDGGGSFKARIEQKYSSTLSGSIYFNPYGYGMEAYDLSLGYQPIGQIGSNLLFIHNGTDVVVDMDSSGIKLGTGKVLKVGGKQVVGAQQAAIADHASDATVNAILAALRSHGLVAA